MGVAGSKKSKGKNKQGGLLSKPQPPKPLTAVSEGDEQAWSSVHVEEDEDHSKKTLPVYSKREDPVDTTASSTPSGSPEPTSTKTVEVPVEPEPARDSAKSIEEKEDFPSTSTPPAEPVSEPVEAATTPIEEPVKVDEPWQQTESEPPKSEDTEPIPEPAKIEIAEEPVAPPREPTPDPISEGGYLIFSTVNDGTLYLQFSYDRVDGAIAYFKPNKVVPAFKYRQNHGKIELIRKLQSNKQGYFGGFVDYLKAAKEFDSDVYLLQQVARVFYQADTSTVYEAPFERFFSAKVSGVAVIPPANTCFDGVKSLSPEQFTSTGNKFGKALRF